MYSATNSAYKSPEICADILRTEVIAIDASPIGRQLHEASDDLLVSLLFLPTSAHFHRKIPSIEPEKLKIQAALRENFFEDLRRKEKSRALG